MSLTRLKCSASYRPEPGNADTDACPSSGTARGLQLNPKWVFFYQKSSSSLAYGFECCQVEKKKIIYLFSPLLLLMRL